MHARTAWARRAVKFQRPCLQAGPTFLGRKPTMRVCPRQTLLVTLFSLALAAAAAYADDGQGSPPTLGGPIFDIAHFDVIPATANGVDFQQTAYSALFKYRDASLSDRGLRSFRAVNWVLAPNHSQIIDVWSSREAFEEHLAQPHSVDFRFAVQIQPPPPPGFNCCI